MPKKWENHWDGLDSEEKRIARNRKLLTLGNLTIITQSLNASIRDANWQAKRQGRGSHYGLSAYSGDIETVQHFLEKEEWDEAAIEERAQWLYEKACEVWQI